MKADFLKKLIVPAQTKIVMLIMDGLGGLPLKPGGKTELECASTPHLDRLAGQSVLGLSQPLGPGITVGSGPGHLAIFGYDPLQYEIGRGALEALGVDMVLEPDDIAARGNFCTVDSDGLITDRRAGRIPTELSRELLKTLRKINIDGVEIFLKLIKEHRFSFIMRGPDLGQELSETDPLKVGLPTLPVRARDQNSEKSAVVANQFIQEASKRLAGHHPANMIVLRGFAKFPTLPSYSEMFGLNAAAIAVEGMYRGVARLAGMKVLDVNGISIEDEFITLERYWDQFDFFYIHIKQTDTAGESGDFQGKVQAIEDVDRQIPRLMNLHPDVVIVSGDHSSPAVLKSHSWHPVPTLLFSNVVRSDGIAEFGERACSRGSLGVLPATSIMPIALANAQRIAKYSA